MVLDYSQFTVILIYVRLIRKSETDHQPVYTDTYIIKIFLNCVNICVQPHEGPSETGANESDAIDRTEASTPRGSV